MLKKLYALSVLILILVACNYGIGYIIGRIATPYFNNKSRIFFRTPLFVRTIFVNPALARITLYDVAVASTSATEKFTPIPVFTADKIMVDFEWMPLFFRKGIIERMIVARPTIHVSVDDSDNSLMFFALPFHSFVSSAHPAWKKYPPLTVENAEWKDGHITIVHGSSTVVLNNMNIMVSKFWQSPDRTRKKVEFITKADVGNNQGSMRLNGEYSYENKKHSFVGELFLTNVDIAYAYSLWKEKVPFTVDEGRITMQGKPVCTDNQLNTIVYMNIDSLRLSGGSKQQNIAGISVEQLKNFLASTEGSLRSDIHITGTVDHPVVNLNEILSQIIAQKMQKDVLEKIDKKASRTAQRLSEYLKKKSEKK